MRNLLKSKLLVAGFILLGASVQAQQINILKDPMQAVAARINLIQRAQRTIRADYYIFSEDISGYTAIALLRDAAKRGVKVQLLVDAYSPAPHENLTDTAMAYLQHLAKNENLPIEFRQYNPADWKRPISSKRRRSHDKSLTVDEHSIIVGSRNLGDPYLQVPGKVFNDRVGVKAVEVVRYDDLDVLIEGKGEDGKTIREAVGYFDEKWQLSFVKPPKLAAITKEEIQEIELRVNLADTLNRRFFAQNPHSLDWRKNQFSTPDVEFLHDPVELKRDLVKSSGLPTVAKHVYAFAEEAMRGDKVHIYAPYLILTPESEAMVRNVVAKGAEIHFYTHPLNASDVDLTGIVSPFENRKLMEMGARVHGYADDERVEQRGNRQVTISPRLMHHKVLFVERKSPTAKDILVIGSMNFDPRSQDKNTEIGFSFRGRGLGKHFQAAMEDSPFEEMNRNELLKAKSPKQLFREKLTETGFKCLLNCMIAPLKSKLTGTPSAVKCHNALDLMTIGKGILFRGDL